MFNRTECQYVLKWAKKIKAINLLGGKCDKCGITNPAILDFHHKSQEKEFIIHSVNLNRWSVIEKEIKVCTLLCSNCHGEIHYNYNNNDSAYNKLKKELLEKMGFKGCCKCGYWGENFASIVFHHRDKSDKKFTNSNALNRSIKVSVSEIFDEIKKCDIICENCHRLEHFNRELFEKLYTKIIEKANTYKELSSKIDRNVIIDMYVNKKMKQSDIRKELGCAKSTICMALKKCLNK